MFYAVVALTENDSQLFFQTSKIVAFEWRLAKITA
jgi:hypothetical protein